MKDMKKFKLVKIEGIPFENSLSCCISSNTHLLEVISHLDPSSEGREVELPMSSLVDIRIKDPNKAEVFGVTFQLNLLPSSKRWVPLSESPSKPLACVPDEVPWPRVLLQVSEPEEMFENYSDQGNLFESFASELVIASLIDSPGMDSEDLSMKNDIKTKCKKQSIIIQILSKQLEINKDKAFQFSNKIDLLEKKIVKFNEQINFLSNNYNQKKKSLLEILQNKDQELHASLTSITSLQSKVRHLENEKEHMADHIKRLELELERLGELEQELDIANTKLINSENIQEQLNKTLIKLSRSIQDTEEDGNFKTQLALKDQEIQMLKSVTEEIKKSGDMQISSLNMEIKELQQLLKDSYDQEASLNKTIEELQSDRKGFHLKDPNSIDSMFSEALKNLKIPSGYTKLKDFTYQVKGKVITVALCRGGLFARIGSSLLNIDEVLQDLREKTPTPNLRDDTSYTERGEKSLEVESGRKNMAKVSSQRTFLKGTKSSLSKAKSIEKAPLTDRNVFKSVERKKVL
jgi:hypothetical protein